jgi:hypothetical protein
MVGGGENVLVIFGGHEDERVIIANAVRGGKGGVGRALVERQRLKNS